MLQLKKIFKFKFAILLKIIMPEDFENILSSLWHRLYDFYFFSYGIKVDVVEVEGHVVVVVDVVVTQALSSATLPKAFTKAF